MYDARVLADSVSPSGVRLITVLATFPRFLLAEVNTHRMFSRNSASSRAIPTEKMIERVQANPFVPETFNKRVKGMGIGEELDEEDSRNATIAWMNACDSAITYAKMLNEIGIDKSRANRILEPFMWHTAIISSTEWDNFFALRVPPGEEPDGGFPAQWEFQKIGILMREKMRDSSPQELDIGGWHLPLVSLDEWQEISEALDGHAWDIKDFWAFVSAGRCARVSYDNHDEYEEPEKSFERAERLKKSGHLSPFEHAATPLEGVNYIGNFRGWHQLRKMIPNEENLVGILERRRFWDAPLEDLSDAATSV